MSNIARKLETIWDQLESLKTEVLDKLDDSIWSDQSNEDAYDEMLAVLDEFRDQVE
ncbi:MAG: hypothetical protein V3U02_10780 [Calditrichia bacterium]